LVSLSERQKLERGGHMSHLRFQACRPVTASRRRTTEQLLKPPQKTMIEIDDQSKSIYLAIYSMT
jgi:hypothetical protein